MKGMNVKSLQSTSTPQQPVTACTPMAVSLYDQFTYTLGHHEIPYETYIFIKVKGKGVR